MEREGKRERKRVERERKRVERGKEGGVGLFQGGEGRKAYSPPSTVCCLFLGFPLFSLPFLKLDEVSI